MKNMMIRYGLMTVLALAAVACAKEDVSESSDNRELVDMTFTASIDQNPAQTPAPASAPTKTYLDADGKTVRWHEDDVIGIHDGLTDAKNTDYNQQFTIGTINDDGSAVFKGTAAADQEVYYATYPYDANNFVTSEGKMRIAFISNQTASAPGTFDQKFNSSAAVLKDGVLNFKNIGGLLKFTLAADNVKKVTLTANDGGTVGGVYYVYFDENGDIDETKTTLADGRAAMYLTPSGAETFEPGTYYLVISPRTYTGGLSLYFSIDGENDLSATTTDAVEVQRSKITNLGTFDTSVAGNVAVTFPVVFPLGFPEDSPSSQATGYNAGTDPWLESWVNDVAYKENTAGGWSTEHVGQHGLWRSKLQPQAYMTWNWSEAIASLGVKHAIEVANTRVTSNQNVFISSVGVKGIWTGDYFEFTLPVKNFAANTTLRLTMPIYTRQGPTFWEVTYLDGDEWKTTAEENLPAYSGATVTAKATWAVPYLAVTATTDNEQTVDMTFENAVASGDLKIRVICADGSILSSGANKVTSGKTGPYTSSGAASAPFYFYNPGKRDAQEIRFAIVD